MTENPYESPNADSSEGMRPWLSALAYLTAALNFVVVFGIAAVVGLIGEALLRPWLFADGVGGSDAGRLPILCYWIGAFFVAGLLATFRVVWSLKKAKQRVARIAALREEEHFAIETAKRSGKAVARSDSGEK